MEMRAGRSPEDACRAALEEVCRCSPGKGRFQVGFIALAPDGRHGAFSLRPGFRLALWAGAEAELFIAPHLL